MRRRFLALALVTGQVASAQGRRPDPPPPPTLGAVVVIAERAATPLNLSTAAVTRLTADDLARLPYVTVADVLKQVPGFAVVDFDGLGRDPQLMVRGFYGGGEADYVQVMVDGRPVNLVHNGTVNWEILPALSSIQTIEIVRGSASALHGDAAVAGVINIVTRRSPAANATWHLTGESYRGISGSADVTNTFLNRELSWSAGFDRTSGFRDHAERGSANARATMRLTRQLRATLQGAWRSFDEPGPLLESLLHDGTESDPRFRDDGGEDKEVNLRIDHDGSLGAGGTLTTSLRFDARQADLVRTLPLTPDNFDTKRRELNTLTFGATTQADLTPTILPPGIDRFSFGLSANLGAIDSDYSAMFPNGPGLATWNGDGSRVALGTFAHLVASQSSRVRWTFGARADLLRDSFTPDGGENLEATHFAFSPKLGVNVRYAESGNAWMSASRTFKAPTLDQLFDQRPIPIPFPPFSLTTSNPELEPQRGTSVEAGAYHDVAISSARLGLTVTVYEVAMRDELDFDLQTFKYVNIARSRHRGFETGLTVSQGIASFHASLTLQDVVSRAGANAGKRLKAIPGHLLSAGATITPRAIGTISASLTRTANVWLDDANTRRFPSWTRVDAQFSRSFGSVALVLGARNLLDERYNTTGFLDASGSGQAYYYPAAGRVLTLGIRRGR